MDAVISPLVPEFETQAKEASYTAGLQKKLERGVTVCLRKRLKACSVCQQPLRSPDIFYISC